jgi:hypothetical protein
VDAGAKALATETGLAQGVGDTTASFFNQVNAANPVVAPGTPIPTPGTAAPGTPMPNVPTVPNPT